VPAPSAMESRAIALNTTVKNGHSSRVLEVVNDCPALVQERLDPLLATVDLAIKMGFLCDMREL
jgi:hypothetical protein